MGRETFQFSGVFRRIFVILLVFSIILPMSISVYAERTILYQDKIDVKKETLEKMFEDVENFAILFSDNIELIETKNNDNGKVATVKINVAFGCEFITDLEYSKQNDIHVVDFVSGELDGSSLTIKLEKTWGFDGKKNGGSLAKMNFFVEDVPCVWPDSLVGDDVFIFAMDKGLEELEKEGKILQKKLDSQKKTESNTTVVTIPKNQDDAPLLRGPTFDSDSDLVAKVKSTEKDIEINSSSQTKTNENKYCFLFWCW